MRDDYKGSKKTLYVNIITYYIILYGILLYNINIIEYYIAIIY